MEKKRLINVRTMRENDLDMVLGWRNHPQVRGFMITQHLISIDEHRAWFELSDKDQTREILVIEEDECAIGCVVFSNVGFKSTADWSFFADPDSEPGTGRKICASALDFAFNDLKIHKVIGRVLKFNETSIRIHCRLGFTQEGLLREHQLIDNEYHDLVLFGILSDEWVSRVLI